MSRLGDRTFLTNNQVTILLAGMDLLSQMPTQLRVCWQTPGQEVSPAELEKMREGSKLFKKGLAFVFLGSLLVGCFPFSERSIHVHVKCGIEKAELRKATSKNLHAVQYQKNSDSNVHVKYCYSTQGWLGTITTGCFLHGSNLVVGRAMGNQ